MMQKVLQESENSYKEMMAKKAQDMIEKKRKELEEQEKAEKLKKEQE